MRRTRDWTTATAPRTTVQSPLAWSESPDWKRDSMNVEALTAAEIARLREENDRAREAAKRIRDAG
jgi:hypothetical protein